jgi:hypothetical protein
MRHRLGRLAGESRGIRVVARHPNNNSFANNVVDALSDDSHLATIISERTRRDQESRDFQRDQARDARRHNNWSLGVAIAAVVAAIAGPLLTESLRKEPTRPIVNVYNTSPGEESQQPPVPPTVSPAPDVTQE